MATLRKLALAALPAVAVSLAAPAAAQPGKGGKTPGKAVEAAVAYLKTTQAEDGSWSKAASPGVTAIVVTGLLKNGVKADDPVAAKALKFVEGMADKEGHLAAGEGVPQELHHQRQPGGPEGSRDRQVRRPDGRGDGVPEEGPGRG